MLRKFHHSRFVGIGHIINISKTEFTRFNGVFYAEMQNNVGAQRRRHVCCIFEKIRFIYNSMFCV